MRRIGLESSTPFPERPAASAASDARCSVSINHRSTTDQGPINDQLTARVARAPSSKLLQISDVLIEKSGKL